MVNLWDGTFAKGLGHCGGVILTTHVGGVVWESQYGLFGGLMKSRGRKNESIIAASNEAQRRVGLKEGD